MFDTPLTSPFDDSRALSSPFPAVYAYAKVQNNIVDFLPFYPPFPFFIHYIPLFLFFLLKMWPKRSPGRRVATYFSCSPYSLAGERKKSSS